MPGISERKLSFYSIFFLVATLFSSSPYASTNDLLRSEQWALKTIPTTHTTGSGSSAQGTCASTPSITGNQYTCSTFTDPAVENMDLNAFQAWDVVPLNSPEVIIALIDTGIDYLHPDLASKVWLNPGEALWIDGNGNGVDDGCEDGIDLDNNGYLDDCHGINTQVDRYLDPSQTQLNPAAGDPLDSSIGHGTNMAGVLGAIGNNADTNFHGGVVGITGIHHNIRLLTCAAADLHLDVYMTIPNLGGAYGTKEDILECFDYFLDLKNRGENIVVVNGSGGASAVNNLFNIFFPVGAIREKYLLNTPDVKQAIADLGALDINVVVAAGNNAWDIDTSPEKAYYPAAFDLDNIIAVGATNNQGQRWDKSSYGRWSIDVFAPGERILSTNPRFAITQDTELSDYIVSDGTSQATAYVSGMIALAKSFPATTNLSASELRRLIISSGMSLSHLSQQSVSGKFARLIDSNNSGFLNCDQQLFQRRHSPHQSLIHRLPGEKITLELVSYNCESINSNQSISISVSPSNEQLTLMDDGVFPDKKANDGVFTTQWLAGDDYEEYQINFGVDSETQVDDIVTVHTSLIVDNHEPNTHRSGSWWPSIYRPGFYGPNYHYALETNVRVFTWKPTISRAGYYEVSAHWPIHSGHSNHAEYTITHGDTAQVQSTQVIANQSINGGQWNSLGTYWFEEGEFDISLSNQNISAAVIADALKLRPIMNN